MIITLHCSHAVCVEDIITVAICMYCSPVVQLYIIIQQNYALFVHREVNIFMYRYSILYLHLICTFLACVGTISDKLCGAIVHNLAKCTGS